MVCGAVGGKAVIIIAFYSDDPRSNPAGNYLSVHYLEKTKICKTTLKEAMVGSFKNISH